MALTQSSTESDWPTVNGVRQIALEEIALSSTNPRARMDEASLRELTESVRQHGILQPILVRPRWVTNGPPPPFELVCGHRRLLAARAAGLAEIPATIRMLDDAAALEVQVIENVERADLHPLDEARGYERLITVHKYDAQRIADRIGRSARYVHDRVKLLALIPALQKLFLEGRITAGHAVVLARLKPADQKRAIDEQKGGLWQPEQLLWDPNKPADPDGTYEGLKTSTVAELQGWVDEHVRFEPKAADPVLFEPTLSEIERARKVIPITRQHYVQPEAKDGSRTYGPRSWKRADGEIEDGKASKTCEHSITGFVAVGPGRGEAFAVCIAREKCAVHWGKEKRERARRSQQTSGSRGASPAKRSGPDEWEVHRAGNDAADEAWSKFEPTLHAAAEVATPEAVLRALAATTLSDWDVQDFLKGLGVRPVKIAASEWAIKAPLGRVQRALIDEHMRSFSDEAGLLPLNIDGPNFQQIAKEASAEFVAAWKAKHAPAAKSEKAKPAAKGGRLHKPKGGKKK